MSALVQTLLWQIKAANLPEPLPELRFAPHRRWRFDLAWPAQMVAVECDGGLFVQGRHSRGAGRLKDMEKANAAVLSGWRVLTVGKQHIASGEALRWIEQALATVDGSPLDT